MNVKAGIKIVEKIIVRIQIFGIGIAEHHAYASLMQFAEEGGELNLFPIIESVAAVCREVGRFADGPVRRVEIDK